MLGPGQSLGGSATMCYLKNEHLKVGGGQVATEAVTNCSEGDQWE